jgi:hypothetical protein
MKQYQTSEHPSSRQRNNSPRQNNFTRSKKTQNLNQQNVIHIAPWLALTLGTMGVIAGFSSNGIQCWTTQNAFLIMLLTNDVYLGMLKKDAARAAAMIPAFNFSAWALAVFIQLGVLFFSLRIAGEFKDQMGHAQVQQTFSRRITTASKATAVQITHNRDVFFYYGIACILADCLGDYGYVFSFTDSYLFLFFWGIVLAATSTLILALAAEFLWAGYNSLRHAMAEWKATYEAVYKQQSSPRSERSQRGAD